MNLESGMRDQRLRMLDKQTGTKDQGLRIPSAIVAQEQELLSSYFRGMEL